MSGTTSVKFDAAVTLRSDDSSAFLESQGSNESPTARVERSGQPMFSFERCVFRFCRTESSIVDRVYRDVMVYGSTVRIVNSATMLVACVVRTESVHGGRGCRVVMRPLDQASVASSTFRVVSNMRNRSGADHVQNRDYIILQLDNSELYISAIEIGGGGSHGGPRVDIIASSEPKTWTVSMFDDGYSPATGFAFASRVLAIEHRHHRSYLTHGAPVRPADHRRAAARRSVWQADESLVEGHQIDIADILASNNTLTSTVYFQATSLHDDDISGAGQLVASARLHCSCTALWIAENLDPTTGGPLRVGHGYRIRHMASGRYLSVAEVAPDRFELLTIGEGDDQFLRRSVFLLDSNAEDEQGHISSYHSFVRLQHVESGLWLASKPHNELSVARTEILRRPSAHDRISLRHPSDSIVSKMLLLMNYMKFLREHVMAFVSLREMPLSALRIAQDQGLRNIADRTNETLLALLQFCSAQYDPSSASHASPHNNGAVSHVDAENAPGGGAGGDAHSGHQTDPAEGEVGQPLMFRSHSDFSSLIPDRERQQMLIELEIPQLVLSVLVAPFTRYEGNNVEEAFPLHGGLLTLGDLHDRQLSHFMQVHTTGLALIERMAKGHVPGSNAAAKYLDILLQLEGAHPKTAASTILTVLESCTCVDSTQGQHVALALINLLLGSHLKPSAAAVYLSCLANLKEARTAVCDLVRMHEREILYTMTTGYGRMLIAPPKPVPPSSRPPQDSIMVTTTKSPGERGGSKVAVAGTKALATTQQTHVTQHDVIPFELFVSHGDADKMQCFIASMELLMRIAPRERDSDGFRFVASRISRDHIIYVLKAGARDHVSSRASAHGDHPIHTIHALFVEAAMTLFLVPSLLESWEPQVLVVSKYTVANPGRLADSVARGGAPMGGGGKESPIAGASSTLAKAAQQIGDATFVRQMKASTMDVLKSEGGQVLQQKGKNLLFCRCVQVWGLILEHNFATPKETEEVIPLLLALMDGRRDQFSAHMSGVSWNRYEHNDHSVPVVDTKIAVCSVLRSYVKSQVRAAAMAAAQSVAAADGDEAERASVGDSIVAELHRRVALTRALLNFPDCCPILIDLVRYQSDTLANAAVGLLTELSCLSETMSSALSEVIVLPSSQRMTGLYQRLVTIAADIQSKLLSGERSNILSSLEALTLLLEGGGRRSTRTAHIRETPVLEDDDMSTSTNEPRRGSDGGTRLFASPQSLTPHKSHVALTSAQSLMLLDDDEAETAATAIAERTQHQTILLRLIGSIPDMISGVLEYIPTVAAAAAAVQRAGRNSSSDTERLRSTAQMDPDRGGEEVHQDDGQPQLLDVIIRFLHIFTAIETNAALISGQWPKLFDLLFLPSAAVGDHLHQPLLRLLERLLPQGNQKSPLNRNDIRSLVRLYREEKYPEVIRALSALFHRSVPRPHQQRDVLTLLVDHEIFGNQWWALLHRGALADMLELLLYCGDGNSIVQVRLQSLLPSESILLFIQTLHADEGRLRAQLIRFLSVVHLRPAELSEVGGSGGGGGAQHHNGGKVTGTTHPGGSTTTGGVAAAGPRRAMTMSTSSPSMQQNLAWSSNELWWRLVRDDFSMRFDELATLSKRRKNWFAGGGQGGGAPAPSSRRSFGGMTGATGGPRASGADVMSWRQQAIEAALCLGNYFRHRFVLQHAVKLDWVMKEVRSLVSSMTQLLFMVSQLELEDAELDALIDVGSTLHNALATLSESNVPRLFTAWEEAAHHRTRRRTNQHNSTAGVAADDASESAVSGGGGSKMTTTPEDQRHSQLLRLVWRMQHAAASSDNSRGAVVECFRPSVSSASVSDPRRFVIDKLLRLCSQQVLTPQAICFLLKLFTECINSSGADMSEMQVIFGECGALHVATVLLDATSRFIPTTAMQLGIAALWGGNTRNQNMFLEYFTTNDERFFVSAKRTLETGAREIHHLHKMPGLASSLSEEEEEDGQWFSAPPEDGTAGSERNQQAAIALPCCKPLLRFIQLLCEGHHFLLQEYCREQRDNIRSVNAVQFCVSFLAVVVENTVLRGPSHRHSGAQRKNIEVEDINPLEETVLQCFANLTEFCQGPCSGNQAMLVSSDLIHIVETLLHATAVVSASVKRAAVTTLIALIEGSTDAHVAETIIRQLSLDNLNRIFHGDVHAEDEDAVGLVFDIGIFLRTVGDLLSETRQRQPFSHRIESILASRADIDQQTGRIQIERDHHLELVYFRIPSSCRRIRYDSKEKLLWEVDRSSQSAKYSSFHDLCEDLILELDLVVELEQIVVSATSALSIVALKSFLRKGLNASQRTWVMGSVFLASITNLLLLVEVRAAQLHMPIAFMQIVVCSVALVADWNIAGAVHLHKQRRKEERITASGSLGRVLVTDGQPTHNPALDFVVRLILRWMKLTNKKSASAKSLHQLRATTDDAEPESNNADDDDDHEEAEAAAGRRIHKRIQHCIIKATRPSFLYTICMLCCSLGGFVWPEFFAMHLFWCVSLSPALQNVVAAVTLNRRTLAVTLFLGMLFCYAFSLVGFALFPDDFDTDDDELTRENCDSLLHCFVFIATSGLRQGGGVGDAMKTIPWGAKNFAARRVFDFLYFAIMIVIFLNILFGIIIDTFAELRDAKHAKERDMRMKCFVCGLDSHMFDQYGDGFVAHTKSEHSMWQYLYFMQHLRLKDPNDYTGQESYVSTKLSKKDFSFFPTRSLNLERRDRMIRERESKHQRSDLRGGDGGSPDDGAELSPSVATTDGQISSGVMTLLKTMQHEMQSQRDALRLMTQSMTSHASSPSGRSPSRTSRSGGVGVEHSVAPQPAGIGHLIRKASTARGNLESSQLGRSSGNNGVCVGGGSNMAPLLLTGNELRVGENVSTQTTFSESTVALEASVLAARQDAAQSASATQRLKAELRAQMDEMRKFQLDRQHLNELQQALASSKDHVRDQQRLLDSHTLERDTALRQNAFLQSEVDRVALENAKLSSQLRALMARERVGRSFRTNVEEEVSDSSSVQLRSHVALGQQVRDRSGYFASLVLDDLAGLNNSDLVARDPPPSGGD